MADLSFKPRLHGYLFYPKYWLSWCGILVLGVFAFIPAVLRDALADMLSRTVCALNIKFKQRVLRNFSYAFPHWDEATRQKIYQDFVRIGLKVILGYGECYFRSRRYLRSTYLVTGQEHLDAALNSGRPVLFMGSHSWAVDHCGVYLTSIGVDLSSFMHTSKNPVYDYFMNSMRLKFGGRVFERSSGTKHIIRALREGKHTSFYADEDLGAQSAVFVNFFASQKATLVVIARMAKMGRAIVVPMFSSYNEQAHKYEVIFDKALENFPSDDDKADARATNQAIEKALLDGRLGQYMWFLPFYRTRPQEELDGHS